MYSKLPWIWNNNMSQPRGFSGRGPYVPRLIAFLLDFQPFSWQFLSALSYLGALRPILASWHTATIMTQMYCYPRGNFPALLMKIGFMRLRCVAKCRERSSKVEKCWDMSSFKKFWLSVEKCRVLKISDGLSNGDDWRCFGLSEVLFPMSGGGDHMAPFPKSQKMVETKNLDI